MHTTVLASAPDTSPETTAERHLRTVLRVNATTSGAGGATALVAGGAVADLLGVEQIGWVRLVGAGLVAFALVVAWVSSGPIDRLRRETSAISAGDIAWVTASATTIALGWYSTLGAIAIASVALVVGILGSLQLVLWRGLRQTTGSPSGVS